MVTLKDEAPKTSCPFTFHAQIHSVGVPEYLMQELEDELQNPTGISTVSTPKLSVSGILLSRECGVLYEVTNSEGLRCASCPRKLLLMMMKTATGHTLSSARSQRVRAIWNLYSPLSHRHWVLAIDAGLTGISYLILLILFFRQTEHSRTPSGISRVSLWTFLIQATMDSVSFAGHITFAILAEGRPSLSLIAPAFLACLVFVHEAVRKCFPFYWC